MPITSIPTNDRKERFVATAAQTVFPYDFPIYAETDLQVLRERAGVISALSQGTDYTVTGAGEQTGGNITLTTGAQLNDIIVLLSAMPSGRTAQYVNGGDLPASALEGDFNRIRILLQQILRDSRASLFYPTTDGPMPDLPPSAARAGRFLAFDAQGQPYAIGAPDAPLGAVARSGDTMTGPLQIAAGTAAAPGLTPAGDSNSGIFAPAADEIGISLNGQEVARFNSNGLVGRLVPRTWLDVASAPTIDLGAQNADSLRITGTTGITSLGIAPSGTRRRLRFAAVLTITHSAALLCPGAANIITAANDLADVESLGSGNWVIESFTRASGVMIVPLGSEAAPSLAFSGDSDTGALSPGANRIQFATSGVARQEIAADGSQLSVIPGGSTLLPDFKCRAWVNFNGQGTVAIRASGNVSSITDHGTGEYTVNFTTAMPDANYAPFVSAGFASYISFINLNAVGAEIAPTTSGFRFITNNASNTAQIDQKYVHVSVFR
jgi:hypothetical protein